ncbi:uncharacterized protein [Maniola hyperantus]|uniref:uncharacterized protein n=1 Tax=Aphantopus hyperantus TaxID=2795564 RepID=UPI0037483559
MLLRRRQRIIAVRAIRGYRTVSWTAATLLAGDPPWELQAEVLTVIYRYRAVTRARGERPEAEENRSIRALIARPEETPACHECGAPEDTAYHTLVECAAWGPQRHILSSTLRRSLSLSNAIDEMISSETSWGVMASFCETVISLKEAAERERELDADAHPLRRRRQGRRRRQYAHLLLP